MTTLEYVKGRLAQDYSEKYEALASFLDKRLDAMKEPGTTDKYQLMLEESVYPFLACMDAMEFEGFSKAEIQFYTDRIWEERPAEIQAVAEIPAELLN